MSEESTPLGNLQWVAERLECEDWEMTPLEGHCLRLTCKRCLIAQTLEFAIALQDREAAAEARAAAAEARGDFWKSAAFNGERDTANQRAARHAAEQARDAERARADAAVAAAGLLARCVAMMNSMIRSGEYHSPTSEIEMRAALDAYSNVFAAAQQGAEGQPEEGRAP